MDETSTVLAAVDVLVARARRGEVPTAAEIAALDAHVPALAALGALGALGHEPATDKPPYARHLINRGDAEIMIARWQPGASCAPHDHGGSHGFVIPLRGTYEETPFQWRDADLIALPPIARPTGVAFAIDAALIHAMTAQDVPGAPAPVTLHIYAPRPTGMRLFDRAAREVVEVAGDAGAWLSDGHTITARTPFAQAAPALTPVIWVGHTINYRGGSAEFAVAARTLADDLARRHPGVEVIVAPLDRKRDFVDALTALAPSGRALRELHFVGHSGMYGIMFGSVAWPEQLSPHEWRELATVIPFTRDARAYFHACRTGRWFAPFFARTFGVTAYGHQGYTTVSARADRFAWAGPRPAAKPRLYLVATPGKKSHGVLGTLRKYRGAAAEPMLECVPAPADGTTSYDAVAELYDRAWADVRVRRPEWAWIQRRMAELTGAQGRKLDLLEIGCGNGALLRALSPHLASGIGLDDSAAMLDRARARSAGFEQLRFAKIHGPVLELADSSVDVVVTFLSFRYLDWDPIMAEIRRVLRPGGALWVVDMVEAPVAWHESPKLVRSAIDHVLAPLRHPEFVKNVKALVTHPDWKTMLKYNPIRAEHEYRWYFESRFPAKSLEVLHVTPTQRVVAFDTGPLPKGTVQPLSFP